MISGRFSPRGRHGRRIAEALVAITSLAALAALAPSAVAAPTPALQDRLDAAAPDARIAVIATLARQVDGERYTGRPQALLRALQRTADATQEPVIDGIDAPVRAFWLINAVAFTGTPAEVREVAGDPAVETVDLDTPIVLTDAAHIDATPFPDAGEGDWGLAAIRVPAAWSTFGLRGAGVRVGTIDTGIDATNPDLAGKVAAWRDFVTSSPTPVDDNGHGTHTAGTIAGGSAGGAAIGVAPEARLVVAKAMGANGIGAGSTLLAAAEWMTDPDGDPATADQPGIVSNSWSASSGQRHLVPPDDPPLAGARHRAGLRRRQHRPRSRVDRQPGRIPGGRRRRRDRHRRQRPGVLEPRADRLAERRRARARRRARCSPSPTSWPRASASSRASGPGYLSYSGTSMAAPHVAGVAALVRQANPSLPPAAVADILRGSAVDLGTAGPDPSSGMGRVDALRAVEAAAGPSPDTRFTSTPGPVTNAVVARIRHRPLQRRAHRPHPGRRRRLERADHRADAGPRALRGPARRRGAGDRRARASPTPRPARHARDGRPHRARAWPCAGPCRALAATFRGSVSDALSGPRRDSIRWSFGEGDTARGARVVRRFAESRRRWVVLSARDAAGNESFAVRALRPRAASAVRGLTVPGGGLARRRRGRGRGPPGAPGPPARHAAPGAHGRPDRRGGGPGRVVHHREGRRARWRGRAPSAAGPPRSASRCGCAACSRGSTASSCAPASRARARRRSRGASASDRGRTGLWIRVVRLRPVALVFGLRVVVRGHHPWDRPGTHRVPPGLEHRAPAHRPGVRRLG